MVGLGILLALVAAGVSLGPTGNTLLASSTTTPSSKKSLPSKVASRPPPYEDPRMDKRLRAFLRIMSAGASPSNPPVRGSPEPSTRRDKDTIIQNLRLLDRGFEQGNAALAGDFENSEGVRMEHATIEIADAEKDLPVTIYEPRDNKSIIGTIVFMHGGGMALESPSLPIYVRFAKELARLGVRAILPEYRKSAYGHPFPRGLEDCFGSAMWASQHFNTPVVLAGASGGGNLALATCLLAKERGQLENIAGCFVLCPMINGKYPNPQYPSIEYFDNYLCRAEVMNDCAEIYTTNDKDAESPLAWPSKATTNDLEGLPPMLIHVNELDLLYDENVEFYRKLLSAGNQARMTIAGGTLHSTEMFSGLVEDNARAMRASMVDFVKMSTEDARSKKKASSVDEGGDGNVRRRMVVLTGFGATSVWPRPEK